MSIKTLLLSSAAVLAAQGHAFSADAIIAAEPEPIEYVRVCDTFGAGYFFIPGTETCLKLSGEARMRVVAPSKASALEYDAATTTVSLTTSGGDSYKTLTRGRLAIDAKSDTELGELHGRLRLQGSNDGTPSTAAAIGLNQAFIQFGGLFVGYHDSAWLTTTNGGASGYGGNGIYDGSYGGSTVNALQYQFNGDSWFAAISLEDDADATSYTPDIVGRLGAVIAGVTLYGVIGYDQDNGKDDDVWNAAGFNGPKAGEGDSEFGLKLGMNSDIGPGNLIVQGFYASGTTGYGANLGYLGQDWTPEWSILASYSQAVSDTVTAYINGQYFNNFYTPDDSNADGNAWFVSGGFDWTPVNNLTLTANGKYTRVDDDDAFEALGSARKEQWEFVVQLARSF